MATRTMTKLWIIRLVVCFTVLFFAIMTVPGSEAKERIRVSRENPRYWEYNGKQVLLLGGSDEDNLFNNPELLMRNLDDLAAIGGNYIRSTLSCRDEGDVWPYAKKDGKYDLNSFNPEFWNRLETSIREAEKRDIIVQIEFFATFDYYRDIWVVNPFNPVNNINYTTDNTRLVSEWDHHPARNVQPFFYSLPALNNDTALLNYQEAFVRKVLDVTLPYSNVLYALDNETRAPAEWAFYWGDFIKKETAKRGSSINLTEMWDQWDITHEDHTRTYGYPEFFAFTDISQNTWQEGQTQHDRLIWYRENLKNQPGGIRPMNNVKVYSRLNGNRPNDPDVGVARWWRNVFAGCASTRFHRPPGGNGLNEKARRMIRAARTFTSAFDIFACEPSPDLLSDREENEAYCLADPGEAYAVYFPKGGQVILTVEGDGGDYRIRWFDVTSARFGLSSAKEAVAGSSQISLVCPHKDRMCLVLVDKKAD